MNTCEHLTHNRTLGTIVQLHTCSQRVHKLYMLYIFVSERHIEKHLDVIVTEVHLVIITIDHRRRCVGNRVTVQAFRLFQV